jgi:hypothetical protein
VEETRYETKLFLFQDRYVHLMETPEHGMEFVEVTPQYLADYIPAEFPAAD